MTKVVHLNKNQNMIHELAGSLLNASVLGEIDSLAVVYIDKRGSVCSAYSEGSDMFALAGGVGNLERRIQKHIDEMNES